MVEISTNILTSLGAGSGIDVKQLVGDILAAERAAPQKALDQRRAAVEARISAQGTLLSALSTLTNALDSRIGAGALTRTAKVSDPSVLSLTAAPGSEIGPQSIEVVQLAHRQTVASEIIADPSAALGAGEIRIRFGSVDGGGAFGPSGAEDLVIDVTEGADTLEGIRNLINANARVKGAGVEAQIVTDAGGARLMLRGDTGEMSGFIVETSGSAGLEVFRYGDGVPGGMTRSEEAADAVLRLNGVEVRRPGNVIGDLVDGATITLHREAPGVSVGIEARRDTGSLTATMEDLVEALNELKAIGESLVARGTETEDAGALARDSAAKRALRGIDNLVVARIATEGDGPQTLSDLGVSIDRNGRFVIDEARMLAAAENDPDAFEAIIVGLNTKGSGGAPDGALRAIEKQFSASAKGSGGHLGTALMEQKRILEEQARLDARLERSEARYVRQFSALDSALSSIKSQQEFLQQQIDMWTRKDSW